jgi:metal-sulfur cluster biosynthetic enzyme
MELYNEASRVEIKVYDLLKKVIDPELGINIIDMGLVYDIKYQKENGINITMTLSSEGCPMGDIIMNDITSVLNVEFPESEHKVELTWTPKWTSDFIKPNGKKLLGID